jgi:hypothetical protein
MTSKFGKYFLALASAALLCPASAWAGFQSSAPTIDGDISDLEGSDSATQTVAGSFGSGVGELLNMRVSYDATNLYVGIAGLAEGTGASGTRGFWLVVDSVPAMGQNTLSISTGPGGAQGLSGAVLESGFDADYVLFWQNGDGGNRQNYFLNVVDLNASSETFYGTFDVDADTFSASGSEPVGFAADYDGDSTSGNFSATEGFEFQIPLSALGIPGGSPLRVLAGSGDGGNGYWSNQTLPSSNSTTNLGGGGGNSPLPDFEANTYGAFGGMSGDGFAGSQTLTVTSVPVELSAFGLE